MTRHTTPTPSSLAGEPPAGPRRRSYTPTRRLGVCEDEGSGIWMLLSQRSTRSGAGSARPSHNDMQRGWTSQDETATRQPGSSGRDGPRGGPVRGMQETAARATALLSRYPWLIIAAGALVGYQLHRAKTRPARPVPHPPPRAAVPPPRESPRRTLGRPSTRPRGGGRRARAARRWCSWTGTCPGRWMACRLRPACGRSGACRSSI
jgi:hypothetical protein